MTAAYLSVPSPVGVLTLFEDGGSLVAVEWGRAKPGGGSAFLDEAAGQLSAYFDGKLRKFDLPVRFATGTEFQKTVWAEIAKIPYGEIKAYGDIAQTLDSGPRPVGSACGKNPVPIVVPCHRVLAAGGAMGGYSGGAGLPTKEWLLRRENFLLV